MPRVKDYVKEIPAKTHPSRSTIEATQRLALEGLFVSVNRLRDYCEAGLVPHDLTQHGKYSYRYFDDVSYNAIKRVVCLKYLGMTNNEVRAFNQRPDLSRLALSLVQAQAVLDWGKKLMADLKQIHGQNLLDKTR